MRKSIRQILAAFLCFATMMTSLPFTAFADSPALAESSDFILDFDDGLKTFTRGFGLSLKVLRIFSAGKAAFDAFKDGKKGPEIASVAIYGMLGQPYMPDSDKMTTEDYFAEIRTMNSKIEGELGAITEGVKALSKKLDGFQQEEYVNSFLYDYVDGGYVDLVDAFFTEYSDFIYYLQDDGISEETLKKAYDELYIQAEGLEKFLNIFMTTGVLYNGEFVTIQQLMYNTLGKDAYQYARGIYENYVLAQYCLQICHVYQIQYCAYNNSDYSVSADNSFTLSGVINRISREGEKYSSVTENILSFFADESSQTAYAKAPGAAFVSEISTLDTVTISPDYRVYMNTLPGEYSDLFDPDLFTFVSSNTSIATVDQNGWVTFGGATGECSVKLMYQYDDVVSLCCYETKFNVASKSTSFSGGLGTKEAPFVLSTAADIQKLGSSSSYWGAGYYYVLKNNINLSGVSFSQIGNASAEFKGSFNGNGYAITNADKAIFGFNSGVIENLTVSAANVTTGYQIYATFYAGGIVIKNSGIVRDCNFRSGSVNVSNSRPDDNYLHYSLYVGGICGYNEGTVERCVVSYSTIKGTQQNYIPDGGGAANDIKGYVGGIAGYVSGGTVNDCLSKNNTVYSYTTSVSYYVCIWYLFVKDFYLCKGYAYAGDIAGYASSSTLTRCLALGNNIDAVWSYRTAQASGNTSTYSSQEGASYEYSIAANSASSFNSCLNLKSGSISADLKANLTANGWNVNDIYDPSIDFKGSAITIVKVPYKAIYSPNEEVSTAGAVLKTNTGELIVDGYTVENFNSASMGNKVVTVNWIGMTANYDILVSCNHLGTQDKGHAWDGGKVLIPSTHLINGIIEYTCDFCGAKRNEQIDVESEHNWSEIKKLSDKEHYRECPCGEVEISAHIYGEWTIVNTATCEEAGIERRDCTDCDHYEIRLIDALGHMGGGAVIENYTDASCTKNGGYDEVIYCTVCSKEINRVHKTIEAGGHNIVLGDVTEFGDLCVGRYECTNCDEAEEKEINGFFSYNDGLYYCENGILVSSWFAVGGITYYASTTTNLVINYSKTIGGKYYIWNDETGLEIADGFVFDGTGYKCYEDGINVIGWRHADGSGPKVVNGISEQYSSNPEGLYYFLSTTGYMVTESTYKLGGYIREFNDDHTVKAMNGLQTNGGELYYYVDGVKQTGWHTIDGTTYYFRASDAVYGRAATKWMYIGNKVYYFYASTSATPYALKNEGKIGGIEYTYHEDGYILYNGFVNCDYANAANSNTAANIQKMNGTTRYYKNGEMQTGWQNIGGNWYYFYAIGSANGSGYMCVQSRTIGGVWYEFTETGVCTNK